LEPWVGDFPEPTDNKKIGGPFNWQFEAAANSYGEHVFIRRNDQEYLGLSQVVVMSDCDCRGVTWDNTGTAGFPIPVEVGSTATGQISNVHTIGSTATPTCTSSDCSPSIEVLLADGSPLPDYMTYDDPTLTVAPTQTSEAGTYSLLVKQQVFQGSTNHLLNEQTLEVEVKCPVTSIAQDTTANLSLETKRSFTIDGAPQTFTPSYELMPNDCSNVVKDMSAELTLANGDPLPSFISLFGTYPTAHVQIQGGTLAEAL